MRILQCNHQFPPFSRQGSELHCWQLTQSLAATDEVAVFHISEVPSKKPRRLERSSPEGYPVFHGIDGGHYARLANWNNPILVKHFQTALNEFKPDVVHFHNYLSLGDDLPTVAKRFGAAVVYTLHDFGLICPNHLLWRTDGKLCNKSRPDFFQDCCPVNLRVASSGQPPLRRHIPPLSRWQVFASQQSNPLVRGLLNTALKVPRMIYGTPENASVPQKREFFFDHTRRIFQDVDLFLVPSNFLMERLIACGLPADKTEHVRYGIRSMRMSGGTNPTAGKIRFGYIGAFHAQKGIEVLLKAFDGLGDRASLHIHGSSFGGPVAESYWKRITQNPPEGFHFGGAYRNEDLERILSDIDVVVVPSLWYENSPFTIQEAFQSGIPVLTSNIGGMAELVRDGIDGMHFKVGDPEDLRRCMVSIIDNPQKLDEFKVNLPKLPTITGQAELIRAHYQRLLGNDA